MAWSPNQNYTRPNTYGTTTTDTHADRRQLDLGIIRGQLQISVQMNSMLEPIFRRDVTTGTGTAHMDAIGGGSVEEVSRTEDIAARGTPVHSGRNSIHVDTHLLVRNVVTELDKRQRRNWAEFSGKLGRLQGQEVARFIDVAYMIQAMKAGLSTTTSKTGLTAADGWHGGTQHSIGAISNLAQPARVLEGLENLITKVQEDKEVIMSTNGVGGHIGLLRPTVWRALSRNHEKINKTFITSAGTSFQRYCVMVDDVEFYSCPWLPAQRNITGHRMSNASNQNAYDGDFTKVVGLIVGVDALFNLYNINVESTNIVDEANKKTFIDTEFAFAVGINDAKHAAVLTID